MGVGDVPTTTLTRPVSVLVDVVNHDEPSVCSNISNGGLTTVAGREGFVHEIIEIFIRRRRRGVARRTPVCPATI